MEPTPRGRPAPGPRLEPAQERRRTAQPEVGAGRGERPDVRAGHPRVQDVAEDHHLAAGQRRVAEVRAHRVQVEQGLGGVGVPAVAAVEHGATEHLGREVRRTADAEWRITSMCAPRASTVLIVSTSDSPFDTEDVAAAMFTTSAERFLAATSKLTRVRVEAS